MFTEDIESRLRPFSSWNLEPYIDEPAHGYFARLVAQEEHDSVRVYANEIGVNGRNIVPSEQLETILQLPIKAEWKERLCRSTPTAACKGGVSINDEILNKWQWSIEKRRFCPGCLAEHAYHRCWWDVLPIRQCPYHRIAIEDFAPDGTKNMWWWPHFDVTPKGESLVLRGIPRLEPEYSFEVYVLGRLGFAKKIAAPLLDSSNLHEAIHACEFLGRILSKWTRQGTRSTEIFYRIGFTAMSVDGARLVQELRKWLRHHVPQSIRQKGYYHLFGYMFNRFQSRLNPELVTVLKRAMHKSLTAENRASEREITSHDFQADDVLLNQFAKQLGIQARGVTAIAKHIGILPSSRPHRTRVFFDRIEATLIKQAFNTLLTTEQVGALIGLPQYQWAPLVKHGILKSIKGTSTKGNVGFRYLRSDVDRLLAEILAGVPEGKRSNTVSLWTLAKHRKISIGDAALLVVKRELVPVSHDSSRVGFFSLRFANFKSAFHLTRGEDETQIPLVTAQAILGLRSCTVTWLADQGYFGAVVEVGLSKTVARDAVSKFAADYADIGIYGRIMGQQNKSLLARLKAAGVVPLIALVEGGNTLVHRRRADDILGINSIGAEALSEEYGKYWRHLVDIVNRTCGIYRMPERLTKTGCLIRARKTSVRIIPLEETNSVRLSVKFHPKKSLLRWSRYLEVRERIEREIPEMSWVVTDDGLGVEGFLEVSVKSEAEAEKLVAAMNVLYVNFRHQIRRPRNV